MNKTYAAIAAAGLFAFSTAAFAADDAAKAEYVAAGCRTCRLDR